MERISLQILEIEGLARVGSGGLCACIVSIIIILIP